MPYSPSYHILLRGYHGTLSNTRNTIIDRRRIRNKPVRRASHGFVHAGRGLHMGEVRIKKSVSEPSATTCTPE